VHRLECRRLGTNNQKSSIIDLFAGQKRRKELDPLQTWEKLLLGVAGVLLLIWFWPGVRYMVNQSKEAPKEWSALIWPLLAVVVLVILLLVTA